MNTSGILNNVNNLDIPKENNLKKFLNKLAYERNFTEVIIFDKFEIWLQKVNLFSI